jgi:Trm5-related predicted tRNA methylase
MVDPIELRKKLSKHQIGPKYHRSMENALQAVQEREEQVSRLDPEIHEHQMGVSLGILSQEELAYCVHNFAMQWEVPA